VRQAGAAGWRHGWCGRLAAWLVRQAGDWPLARCSPRRRREVALRVVEGDAGIGLADRVCDAACFVVNYLVMIGERYCSLWCIILLFVLMCSVIFYVAWYHFYW
jgi:hypothetical protein